MKRLELVKRIWCHLSAFHGRYLVVFGFLVGFQLLSLPGPYLMGKLVDSLTTGAAHQKTTLLIISMVVVYALGNALHIIQDRYETKYLDYDVPDKLAEYSLTNVFEKSLGQHHNENSGFKQSVIGVGEGALRNFGQLFMWELLPLVILATLTLIGLLIQNPIFGAIVVTIGVVYVWITIALNKKILETLKKHNEDIHHNQKRRSELMRNPELILVNAREKAVVNAFAEKLSKTSQVGKDMWNYYLTRVGARDFLLVIARALILSIGVYMVYTGQQSVGVFMTCLIWSSTLLDRLGRVGPIFRQSLRDLTSIERFFKMIDLPSALAISDDPVNPEAIEGKIEFRNVCFSYPTRKVLNSDGSESADDECTSVTEEVDDAALRGVNFVIQPGENVAIVGPNGAGKTTILNLLLRGYDPRIGNVLIDDIDLKQLDRREYLTRVGYIEQGVKLFDDSIKNNILFGVNDPTSITEEQLWQVARDAKIDDLIRKIGPRGFDTLVGERGIKLSGGQAQRVAIARALIKNPSILIFDEATSNVDVENECLIRESIKKASRGRTTIIIAHRFSTIRHVDRIIVLKDGQVEATGTHDELAEYSETYSKLVSLQKE